jgi:hypothetical protein
LDNQLNVHPMKNQVLVSIAFFSLIVFSCKKSGVSGGGGSSKLYSYDSVIFSTGGYGDAGQFFSTFDTSVHSPVPLYDLSASQLKNIDLMYIYNFDYDLPGFIDPVTASSSQWYWNDYYTPSLDSSVQTLYYVTNLTASECVAAKSNPALIETYFKDSTRVGEPVAGIFPAGTCLGGRVGGTGANLNVGADPSLELDKVFGFVNVKSGKKGLLHIRGAQSYGWPNGITDFHTAVDIIREK